LVKDLEPVPNIVGHRLRHGLEALPGFYQKLVTAAQVASDQTVQDQLSPVIDRLAVDGWCFGHVLQGTVARANL
jgi:hypothetical protein